MLYDAFSLCLIFIPWMLVLILWLLERMSRSRFPSPVWFDIWLCVALISLPGIVSLAYCHIHATKIPLWIRLAKSITVVLASTWLFARNYPYLKTGFKTLELTDESNKQK